MLVEVFSHVPWNVIEHQVIEQGVLETKTDKLLKPWLQSGLTNQQFHKWEKFYFFCLAKKLKLFVCNFLLKIDLLVSLSSPWLL